MRRPGYGISGRKFYSRALFISIHQQRLAAEAGRAGRPEKGMTKLFPELAGKERNTLYIIGNGFDLFHGLLSKYIDFYNWLNKQDKKHEEFVRFLEEIFPYPGDIGKLLWSNFEEALGRYDLQHIENMFSLRIEENAQNGDSQENAMLSFLMVTDKIRMYLKEWVMSLEQAKVQRVFELSPECTYLSFNYTLLLENIYKIPYDHVLHIHRSVSDPKPLIIGHNNSFPVDIFDEVDEKESKLKKIADVINSIDKNVFSQIYANQAFFQSLNKVNNVVVIGHSMAGIDMQYYYEIFKHIKDFTNWYFVCHDGHSWYKYQRIVEHINKEPYVGVYDIKKRINSDNCYYKIIKTIPQ